MLGVPVPRTHSIRQLRDGLTPLERVADRAANESPIVRVHEMQVGIVAAGQRDALRPEDARRFLGQVEIARPPVEVPTAHGAQPLGFGEASLARSKIGGHPLAFREQHRKEQTDRRQYADETPEGREPLRGAHRPKRHAVIEKRVGRQDRAHQGGDRGASDAESHRGPDDDDETGHEQQRAALAEGEVAAADDPEDDARHPEHELDASRLHHAPDFRAQRCHRRDDEDDPCDIVQPPPQCYPQIRWGRDQESGGRGTNESPQLGRQRRRKQRSGQWQADQVRCLDHQNPHGCRPDQEERILVAIEPPPKAPAAHQTDRDDVAHRDAGTIHEARKPGQPHEPHPDAGGCDQDGGPQPNPRRSGGLRPLCRREARGRRDRVRCSRGGCPRREAGAIRWHRRRRS